MHALGAAAFRAQSYEVCDAGGEDEIWNEGWCAAEGVELGV